MAKTFANNIHEWVANIPARDLTDADIAAVAAHFGLTVRLRANYTNFCDGIADIGANSNFADGAHTNTTYYQGDGVHLTATGAALAGTIVASAITPFL